MLTNISVLSVNGGHAIVGKPELAPTKPESALERPAIVTYEGFFVRVVLEIFRTSKVVRLRQRAAPMESTWHPNCP